MKIQHGCTLLTVFDMPKSLAFYCGVLGFIIHQQAGPTEDVGWVWLKHNSVDLMLNTAYELTDRPPYPDQARMNAHGDTAVYFGCAELDAVYHELLSKGIDLSPPMVTSYGMKQLYLKDPDGYTLCFQWPVELSN